VLRHVGCRVATESEWRLGGSPPSQLSAQNEISARFLLIHHFPSRTLGTPAYPDRLSLSSMRAPSAPSTSTSLVKTAYGVTAGTRSIKLVSSPHRLRQQEQQQRQQRSIKLSGRRALSTRTWETTPASLITSSRPIGRGERPSPSFFCCLPAGWGLDSHKS
jgi:hypothetical protein